MRRYLGSRITAFAAIVCPLFIIAPLCFTVIILLSEISEATLFLSALFCSCTVIWFVYVKKEALQLYAWGLFGKNDVQVCCFFKDSFVLDYARCTSVGIEYYQHNVIHTNIDSKVFFIYLSYDFYETKYRGKINLWKPSTRRIKAQFDNKLYEYLISVLPQKQAKMLQQDYKKYNL